MPTGSVTADPLVVLHDHLDGGVRPATLLDLAARAGIATPTDDPHELARWLTLTPDLGLADAFSRFDLVNAMLQSEGALQRVTREAVEDLAVDGVIHAELRFAPLLHTRGGLNGAEVLRAVEAGVAEAINETGIDARLIVCAMRDQPVSVSTEAVQLAIAAADGLVVGVDLAGIEPGHPAQDHAAAFALAHEAGLGVTIHAGEMDGPHQVAGALDGCMPHRIGHGWRLIDDCETIGGRVAALGPTAGSVRDAGLTLEICLTSNDCLGMPVTQHPVRLLRDAGFLVTLQPDDRSITTTTARRELGLAADHHGFDRADLAQCCERAAAAAFLPEGERARLVDEVRSGWDAAPKSLVHLAERATGEQHRRMATYVPDDYRRDGFVHLSGLHQLLTPANRFYRGRSDLVALVVEADALDRLVWEPGAGTAEYFPHLYGELPVTSVRAAIDMVPSMDGSFLLPPALIEAVAG